MKIPPKIQIFLWKIEHRVLPSRFFLSIRLKSLMLDITCKLCGYSVEDQNHILWACPFVKDIWEIFFEWWGVYFRFRMCPRLKLYSWLHWFSDHTVKIGRGVSVAYVLWSF